MDPIDRESLVVDADAAANRSVISARSVNMTSWERSKEAPGAGSYPHAAHCCHAVCL